MNAEYIINAMMLFAIVGMCIKIFFGNDTSKDGSFGRANSTIWGYGLVGIAVLTVMFVSFSIVNKMNDMVDDGSVFKFLKKFLTSSGPSLVTIITVFWILSLNISYFTPINKGTVSKEYYQLSAGTSILFIFQIVCLFQYIGTMNPYSGNSASEVQLKRTRLSFATYFIGAINLVVVGMMTILLEFFSTDG